MQSAFATVLAQPHHIFINNILQRSREASGQLVLVGDVCPGQSCVCQADAITIHWQIAFICKPEQKQGALKSESIYIGGLQSFVAENSHL